MPRPDYCGQSQQLATEAEVQLSELIDRLEAAARVTQAELADEFEELAEMAG